MGVVDSAIYFDNVGNGTPINITSFQVNGVTKTPPFVVHPLDTLKMTMWSTPFNNWLFKVIGTYN